MADNPADAQTTVYSNTANRSNTYIAASPFGNTTNILADDITPIAGFAGQQVTGVTYSAANNGPAVTVTPTIYIYGSDGSYGGPGTLLSSFTLAPINSHGFALFSAPTLATGYFTLPSTTFWAGISFNSTTSSIQLPAFGQELFTPPTIGTSADLVFESTFPPTTAVSNPDGILFTVSSYPSANFGWSFQVGTPAVPEASTTVSLGLLLGLGIGAMVVAARRKKITC